MHATGEKAKILTNLFGGAINNEGLGLFSISLDWQYVSRDNNGRVGEIVLNEINTTDYVFQHIPPPQATSARSCWIFRLFHGDARHLLLQRLGRALAAIHVNAASDGRRFNLSSRRSIH